MKIKKTRPLKVYFESQATAKAKLRNKNNMKRSDIKIYSDQTPHQEKEMKLLREELQKRTESGEKNLIIKVKGTPKIIKQPKN